jgi:DNA-binding transcriptional LysR family regulator
MAEIRQLRYFVAVAERGSVSQAALDLHLSQSALSEALRKLEVELGVELLARSSRGVSLTPAGTVMLEEAAATIARFDAALDAVRGAAAGETGRLRVGFEAAGAGRLSTQSRARFHARFPHVRVEPRRYDWGGEVAGLREGECDVAFVWLPADLTGLKSELVATEPRFAGLATSHALARRESLSVNELTDEPIMWTRLAPDTSPPTRLVGRQPPPRRARTTLGPGERERRGDARTGRRRLGLLHRPGLDDGVLRAAGPGLGADPRRRPVADRLGVARARHVAAGGCVPGDRPRAQLLGAAQTPCRDAGWLGVTGTAEH